MNTADISELLRSIAERDAGYLRLRFGLLDGIGLERLAAVEEARGRGWNVTLQDAEGLDRYVLARYGPTPSEYVIVNDRNPVGWVTATTPASDL